jgi:serine protease
LRPILPRFAGIDTLTQSKSVRRSLAAALALALSAPAFAGQVNTAGLTGSGSFDRFIVRFADASVEAKDAGARQRVFDGAARAEGLALEQKLRLAVGGDVVRASTKLDRVRAERLMRRIASHPGVLYVEVDKLNKPFYVPNDSYYSQQWQYGGGNGGIRADQAWDLAKGAGVVVAVLDTGYTNHSDLAANILPGYDFIKDTFTANDGNGRDSDAHDPGDWSSAGQCAAGEPASNSSWHGTHVAGTVAAVTANGKGVAGTAWQAKVLPLRVLGRCGGYDSDIADAMVWASGGTVSGLPANAYPAEVVSLSLGGAGACSSTTQAAINSAVNRGTTIVVAAGNENANVSTSSPANCANVIAVGATTSTGARASYSNYGTGVDIAAPGSGILSTLNSGTQGPATEGYASYSGTSMATPHVSGVVALMQSYASTPKTPAQIESILKSTARAFPSTPSQPIGAGIVNAYAAVQAVNGGSSTPPPSNVAPVANFSVSTSGLTASFSDASSDSDGSIASRSWNFGDGSSSTSTNPSHTYAAAGTYTVTLTVTDNAGATNSKTASVTVSSSGSGGSSGTVLANGVAVALPSVATGSVTPNYTLAVPAGKSSLTVTISGGTGDADLYVRFGAAPTKFTYSCRPYKTGNAETCTFSAPGAGTWYVNVRAYQAFSGVSLKATYN